ncbi:MAG TPA: hypothetical protein DCX60_06475 [Phycisphaerales bacterium]|nr:hypothetical protein [Phycisphaerales bacterium]
MRTLLEQRKRFLHDRLLKRDKGFQSLLVESISSLRAPGKNAAVRTGNVENQQIHFPEDVSKSSGFDDLHVLDIGECFVQFGSSAVMRITGENSRIRMKTMQLVGLGASAGAEVDDHLRFESSGQIHRHRRDPILDASSPVFFEMFRKRLVRTLPDRVGSVTLDHVDRCSTQAMRRTHQRRLPADLPDPVEDQVIAQGGLHPESNRRLLRKDRLREKPCLAVLQWEDVPMQPPLGGPLVAPLESFPSQSDDRTKDAVDEATRPSV